MAVVCKDSLALARIADAFVSLSAGVCHVLGDGLRPAALALALGPAARRRPRRSTSQESPTPACGARAPACCPPGAWPPMGAAASRPLLLAGLTVLVTLCGWRAAH
jgi:hypothetical protein